MTDNGIEIPREVQEKFRADLKQDWQEHEREFRRSLEISAGFYEKLVALDAGSIAVAASLGIALVAKPQLQFGPVHAIAHWLVLVTVFLWLSLLCAVFHNFAVVGIAKLDAAYSEDDFVRRIVRRSLTLARDISSEESKPYLDEIFEKAQHEPFSKQERNVKRRRTLHRCATVLGYFSMASFLLAYTLVVYCVAHLW